MTICHYSLFASIINCSNVEFGRMRRGKWLSSTERSTMFVYLGAYLIYSLWKNDRFDSLRPSKIFSGELKSVLTILLMLMTCIQMTADVTGTYIKYTEGFFAVPVLGIVSKPFKLWSPSHQELSMLHSDPRFTQRMDYVQCIAFSLETGLFFLVQCFWNYLSNTLAKKNFMSSFEFNFFVFWAISSMALFPVLQWYYRDDPLYREIVPQLAYSSETLITAFLGIRNNIRFNRLINTVKRNNVSSGIVNKLNYFRECNNLICIVLFFYGGSFFILCIDGLTSAQVIAKSKLASDILISNANVCVAFYYLLFISTFHPRRQFNTNNQNSTKQTSNDGYKSQGQDVEMDQSRFSQRVTHFVDIHQQQQQGSFDQQQQQQLSQQQQQQQYGSATSQSKLFIRPMSPVTVDQQQQGSYQQRQMSPTGDRSDVSSPPLSPQLSYQHYQQQQQQQQYPPLSSSPTTAYSTREIAIRDPYSSQPVTFSVIDPQAHSYNMNDGSLRGGYSHQAHQVADDGHSDYSIHVDNHYVDDTRQPH
ncbi:hypothetical protein BCR42DRAFT_394600 [Absidia repens]|uniref:Uncharacterized protein n=1 Tax=Absidia repens TaxID=90262 RepID=A0A1X2IAK8_9FUNG|nr:hypothetical protein BCR42DRAFT_394600 [Absidia repens]